MFEKERVFDWIKKMKSFFGRLQKSKKKQMAFCLVSISILVVAYYFTMNAMKKYKEEESIIKQNVVIDYELLYDFEHIDIEESNFIIKGWVMKLGAKNMGVHILLWSDNNDEVILSTDMYVRKDVEEIFEPEYEHGKCGFIAELQPNELELDVCYQVYLVLDYETDSEKRLKVNTDKYICNGKLYNYNPNTFERPNVNDEELLQVINDGIVRAYDIEKEIWIYQYDDMLYYIVNSEFGSMKDNDVKIPVMPSTSRTDLLPEKRIEDGFDHLGAYYEDLSYAREGILPYQVVRVNLSNDYPNTYVSTGLYYTNSKTWYRHFRFFIVDWSVDNFVVD